MMTRIAFFIVFIIQIVYLFGQGSTDYVPPTAVHVAFGKNYTTATISWHTTVQTQGDSIVFYGNNKEFKSASGSSISIIPSAGYEHHVNLVDLQPNTLYNYTCGSNDGFSQEYYFTTGPSSSEPFVVAVLGDMGVSESINTVNRINNLAKENKMNWVYHVGDISYADDYPGDLYNMIWQTWFSYMTETHTRMAYMTCPGNHEYSCENKVCDEYSKDFSFYNAKFAMPGNNNSMWFSFDYSNTHFISISTETDYPNAPFDSVFGDQLTWLENDLKNAQLNNYDWIVVVGHRPIYSSYNGFAENNQQGNPEGEGVYIQEYFEPLFYQYNVDLYITGHVHSYERTYPVYNTTDVSIQSKDKYVNPPYTTHIVIGNAGNKEGISTNYNSIQPKWSVTRYFEDFGYALMSISSTELKWDFYNSSQGTLIDSFSIQK
eukprot:TRINITY_DN6525_c0_g1_i1.p1 TRINITY_DN6525_c0_g1~~TRINITY_DN6525_c0_g1_i1.p1  ORF type:complete len:431 (-),score=93.57 TRINITY_DN6525_c0_g1_i1:171-1463(-)